MEEHESRREYKDEAQPEEEPIAHGGHVRPITRIVNSAHFRRRGRAGGRGLTRPRAPIGRRRVGPAGRRGGVGI